MIQSLESRDSLLLEKSIKKESGQSTIEFLTTMTFAIGLVFFVVRLALVYTNGFLVHYATFMASRSYLVIDNNLAGASTADPVAADEAKKVFESYQVLSLLDASNVDFQVNSPDFGGRKSYVGPYVKFKQRFPSPSLVGTNQTLNLTSESFLGREPTRSECVERICEALTAAGTNCNQYVTFFDNGC